MFSALFGPDPALNNVIRPELLYMELNDGKLAEDDYLAKSYKYLGKRIWRM